jgi:hypothetical protein
MIEKSPDVIDEMYFPVVEKIVFFCNPGGVGKVGGGKVID